MNFVPLTVINHSESCCLMNLELSQVRQRNLVEVFQFPPAVQKYEHSCWLSIRCKYKLFGGIFLYFFVFVGPRSILWSHWLPLFWTSCYPPISLKVKMPSLRVMPGTTPSISTNRDAHCISMCTADLHDRHPPAKGRQQWIANLGSSKINTYPGLLC